MKPTHPSRRFIVLLAVCAAVTFAALCVAGGAIYQRFAQTNDRRAQQLRFNREVRENWHIVLCYLETVTERNPKSTPQQKANAAAVLDSALRKIHAPPCKGGKETS